MPSRRCTQEIHEVFKLAASGTSVPLEYDTWTAACAGRHVFNNCRKQTRQELADVTASLVKGDGKHTEAQRVTLTALVSIMDVCVIRLVPNRKPDDNGPAIILVEPTFAAHDPTSKAIAKALGEAAAAPPAPQAAAHLNRTRTRFCRSWGLCRA